MVSSAERDRRMRIPLSLHTKSCKPPFVDAWRNSDPNLDWTLEDLKVELNAMETQLCCSMPPYLDHSLTNNTSSISWRALSTTANFGRKSGPFVMRAYDDDSEEDNDISDEAKVTADNETAKKVISELHQNKKSGNVVMSDLDAGRLLLPKTDAIEATLIELERERLRKVQEELRQRKASLETSLMEEIEQSSFRLAQLMKDEEHKFEIARRKDKQYQRSIAEARDTYLSEMQRDHEQRSQVEERKIRKEVAAEEARRREISIREAQEREFKARLEAEAKMKADLLSEAENRQAAADVARKQQAEAAAKAALRRSEEERKLMLGDVQSLKQSTQSLSDVIPSKENVVEINFKAGPKPRVGDKAAQLETERLGKLQLLQESTTQLQSNPALVKDLKSLERQVIKIVQQISLTQEQVRNKSMELTALLSDGSKPQDFVVFTLASKLLSLCETQILKLPSFAFPVAQVVVNVAAQIPFVMDVVLAKLNSACIFTVPKYFIFSKDQFENDFTYYKTLGYQEVDGKLESIDEYLARMTAYMTFYAAITQTETSVGNNPHGLKEAWAWCSNLLNRIPANRYSALALEAFLKIAGFRLYQVYPKPFMKVIQLILNEFVVNLKKHSDPDSKAVINQLETYLLSQQYKVEPKGRQLPRTDLSSSLRA